MRHNHNLRRKAVTKIHWRTGRYEQRPDPYRADNTESHRNSRGFPRVVAYEIAHTSLAKLTSVTWNPRELNSSKSVHTFSPTNRQINQHTQHMLNINITLFSGYPLGNMAAPQFYCFYLDAKFAPKNKKQEKKKTPDSHTTHLVDNSIINAPNNKKKNKNKNP